MSYTTCCLTPFEKVNYVPYCPEGDWDGERMILLKDICYIMPRGDLMIVPKGFVTDLGSVPSKMRSFVDNDDESILGFIGHDILFYSDAPYKCSHHEANKFLYEIIRDSGQGWYTAQKTYWAVEAGRLYLPYGEKKMLIDLDYAKSCVLDLMGEWAGWI